MFVLGSMFYFQKEPEPTPSDALQDVRGSRLPVTYSLFRLTPDLEDNCDLDLRTTEAPQREYDSSRVGPLKESQQVYALGVCSGERTAKLCSILWTWGHITILRKFTPTTELTDTEAL